MLNDHMKKNAALPSAAFFILPLVICHWSLIRHSSFIIRH